LPREEGREEGQRAALLEGIEVGLELKFGAEGLGLMAEIAQVQDVAVLRAIQQGLRTASSLDDLRRLIP